ncbi:hypothetical protein LINPERPRIM_LOCUS25223 [Linum perenne]
MVTHQEGRHGVHEVTTSSLVRLGYQRLLPPRSWMSPGSALVLHGVVINLYALLIHPLGQD